MLTRSAVRSVSVEAWEEAVRTGPFFAETARKTVRGGVVARPRDRPLRVDYMHPGEDHWAETDGETVWLSRTKPFDRNSLYWTLLHEELHGVLRRVHPNGEESELSEAKEHSLMRAHDRRLVEEDESDSSPPPSPKSARPPSRRRAEEGALLFFAR